MLIKGSDHYPVIADFVVDIEHEARPAVQAEFFANQDLEVNNNIPRFRVATRQILFS